MDSPYVLVSPNESPSCTDSDGCGDDSTPSPALDQSPVPSDVLCELQDHNEFLLAEVLFLRVSFESLETMYKEAEETLLSAQEQRDKAMARSKMVEELSIERDGLLYELSGFRKRQEELSRKIGEGERERESLEREIYEGMREREDLVQKIDFGVREREGFVKEIGDFRAKIEELEEDNRLRDQQMLKSLLSLASIKESLIGLCEGFDEEEDEIENGSVEDVDELKDDGSSLEHSTSYNAVSLELHAVSKIVTRVEKTLSDYRERTKKEKKELESSVVSLTEENRDVNSLFRIALVEKDAVEKSLNKLKGNPDQKRVALLQIAERGLQRVGFGFMMGAAVNEATPAVAENLSSTASNVSDSSECEEEIVSVASTVEKIMKNLRLEITQLRKALEESRSDIERLQSLTERQAQQITDQEFYIKELEEREIMLTQNVEELLSEIKAAEEDVARWREACELEVEAGKTIVNEREKVADILKQELEKTRSALEVSNSKLKMKEELAGAAMAAQAAAERSVQLADSRAAGLCERIEDLTRQLEEAENKERNGRRVRHICWPWRAIKANASAVGANRISSAKRILPEMQALLH
ncbi:hypothetical protein V2J09_011246 [Rumex salicifolius]